MNSIAFVLLNGMEYRIQFVSDIDGFEIHRFNGADDEADWVTIARVTDKDLAWRTWSAILTADRAGRL